MKKDSLQKLNTNIEQLLQQGEKLLILVDSKRNRRNNFNKMLRLLYSFAIILKIIKEIFDG